MDTLLEKEAMVKLYTPLVKRIAYHLLGRLPHSIQLDDLIQAGMEGLLESLLAYDETKGAAFETYATIRIRGYMLDEVRRNDWVPRSVYQIARRISSAVHQVESRYVREAKDHEIAEALGVSLDEYHEMLLASHGAHLYGFDDLGVTEDVIQGDNDASALEPYSKVMRDDFRAHLIAVISKLPKPEQMVLSLYYEHELTLKEIADILGVTESRVSQIHSQATHRMKARLIPLLG